MWQMAAVAVVLSVEAGADPSADHGLWAVANDLRSRRIVDLTHAFDVDTPRWKGFPAMKRRALYTYAKDGFLAEEFAHVGQYGTHVDPPGHFHTGKRMVDEIHPREMILPLVVMDLHERASRDPDCELTLADVEAWERRYGSVPSGAFVALRTDWSKRWPSQDRMLNRDAAGVAHYPGWGLAALKYLCLRRRITAIGHETTDTDRGLSTSKGQYPCETYLLGQDRYQIELLANLDQVPAAGAMVLVTWPKPKRGSGFPARVLAILPQRSTLPSTKP